MPIEWLSFWLKQHTQSLWASRKPNKKKRLDFVNFFFRRLFEKAIRILYTLPIAKTGRVHRLAALDESSGKFKSRAIVLARAAKASGATALRRAWGVPKPKWPCLQMRCANVFFFCYFLFINQPKLRRITWEMFDKSSSVDKWITYPQSLERDSPRNFCPSWHFLSSRKLLH